MSENGRSGSEALSLDAVEAFVRTVWKEVLPEASPDDDTDFFEVGGDSVAAAMVTTRLSAFVGHPISPGEMFFHPTVRDLALVAWETKQRG